VHPSASRCGCAGRGRWLGRVSKEPVFDHFGLSLEAKIGVVEPCRTVVVHAADFVRELSQHGNTGEHDVVAVGDLVRRG